MHRLFAVSFLLLSGSTLASTHLLLFGGGDLAPAGMARFAEWCHVSPGPALAITWSSSEPAEGYKALASEFAAAKVELTFVHAVTGAELAAKTDEFRHQLAAASCVFFTGGDQSRAMAAMASAPSITPLLREKYRGGSAFAGTSAGTAIMSPLMVTGGGDLTRIGATGYELKPALGLLPGTLVDMHFLRRQRENRMFSALLDHPELVGIGIDEDGALSISDDSKAEVLGDELVMLFVPKARAREFTLTLLQPGDRRDLFSRKPF